MQESIVKIKVWSANIRWFHWLNVIAITLLIAIGVVILNAKLLGVSNEGKVLLKTCHVLVGYVFTFNLLFRLVLGFSGKGFERWNKTLAFSKTFGKEIKEYKADPNQEYVGHNPLAKLMITALLTLMSVQMITGLVLAGTDIYYPPFGQYISQSIAIDKDQADAIQPYSKINVDPIAYKQMREFRKPFITTHYYSFYALLVLIVLHVGAVIFTERKHRNATVSAMLHGYKSLPKEVVDKDESNTL